MLGSVWLATVLASHGALFWAAFAVEYTWIMMILIVRRGRVEFAAANVKVKLTLSLVCSDVLTRERGGSPLGETAELCLRPGQLPT